MAALQDKLTNLSKRQVLAILLSVSIVTSILTAVLNIVFDISNTPSWWLGWLQLFSVEMFGVSLIFVLLNWIVSGSQEKEKLIRLMRSRTNSESLRAVEELRAYRWLFDGSLERADLHHANLEGADMQYARLSGASLIGARLVSAVLFRANLQDADLSSANLSSAYLDFANLAGADLRAANLNGTSLRQSNLSGANLTGIDLTSVDLANTKFDEVTTLPDGSKWKPDTDFTQFRNDVKSE